MTKTTISIVATAKGESDFKLCPAGSHVARCVSVVLMGTMEYQGSWQKSPKVRLTYELPNELEVFNEEKGEQPFVVSRELTLSLADQSHMRPFLEGWMSKKIPKDKDVDVAKFLGVAGMITIVHNESNNGKTYANINSISPLPKGTKCPPQVNPSVLWSITDPDMDAFNEFPEWLQDKIKSTREWAELQDTGALAEPQQIGGDKPLPGEDGEEEDLPDFLKD